MCGLLLYVVETIKYGVLYRVVYEKKLKKIWISVILGVVYFVLFGILFSTYDISGKKALGYGFAWICVLFMLEGKWEKKGRNFFVMYLISIGLEQIVSIPLRIAGLFVELDAWLGEYDSLLLSVLALLGLTTVRIWKEKKKCILKKRLTSQAINTLIAFMVLGLLLTVACVDYAEDYVSNFRFSVLTIFLCAISYVSVGILGVFIIHIRTVNETMDEMLQNEVVLKEMQKSYYEALLKKEEETRSYRHDMVGHLLCLENFAKEGKTGELEAYLSKLRQQISQIQGKKHMTGNQVIDVITNHYFLELTEQTDVQVSGFVEDDLEIDRVSLCSIYMNLLKNAMEELERIKEGKKILKIDFLQGTHFFRIEMRNSLSEQSKEKRDVLESEKEDKRNHGIGLKNVKKIVKEYEGIFDTKIDNGFFVVRIILNYKK